MRFKEHVYQYFTRTTNGKRRPKVKLVCLQYTTGTVPDTTYEVIHWQHACLMFVIVCLIADQGVYTSNTSHNTWKGVFRSSQLIISGTSTYGATRRYGCYLYAWHARPKQDRWKHMEIFIEIFYTSSRENAPQDAEIGKTTRLRT